MEKFGATGSALFPVQGGQLPRLSIEFSQMRPAPLDTERFAWRAPLNMQGNTALSENLISFAGGGNENLFVNKVQAYLLLYSAQYFLKGKLSLSYSHRFSFRQQRRSVSILALSCKKKEKRAPPKFGMRKRNGRNTSRNLIRVTTRNSSDCTQNARCIKATNVKYEYYASGARKSYLSSQGAWSKIFL